MVRRLCENCGTDLTQKQAAAGARLCRDCTGAPDPDRGYVAQAVADFRKLGAVGVVAIVVGVFAVVGLIAGGGDEDSPTSALRSTSSSLDCDGLDDYREDIQPISGRFVDKFQLAIASPRITVTSAIGDLQDVRADFREVDTPSCATSLRLKMLTAMDYSIDALLLFAAGESDAAVEAKASAATTAWTTATQELERLR